MTTENKTVGEIVAEDYRTAQVFNNHKIDFCCKGSQSISEAAKSKNLDPGALMAELEAVQQQNPGVAGDYHSWRLDLLTHHIEKKHHRYVEEQIPVIKQYLDKICQRHGSGHPELFEIAEHFRISAGELTKHMKKEELMLFPVIRKMVNIKGSTEELRKPHFGSIQNPIQIMMHEHESEGERFWQIRALSDNYTTPADGCNTYRVALNLLKDFEADLHMHLHLENNILFPKALALEGELNS